MSERIKCLLSSPFIPFPPVISLFFFFWGEEFIVRPRWEEIEAFLLVVETRWDVIIIIIIIIVNIIIVIDIYQSSAWLKFWSTNSTTDLVHSIM